MNLDLQKDIFQKLTYQGLYVHFLLVCQEKRIVYDSTSFVVAQEMFCFGLLSVSARKGKDSSEAHRCSLSHGQAVRSLAEEVPSVTSGPFPHPSVTTLVTLQKKYNVGQSVSWAT